MNPFISVIRYTKKGFDLEKQVSAASHVPALLSFMSQNFLHARQHRKLLAPVAVQLAHCLHKNQILLDIVFFLILTRNSKDV